MCLPASSRVTKFHVVAWKRVFLMLKQHHTLAKFAKQSQSNCFFLLREGNLTGTENLIASSEGPKVITMPSISLQLCTRVHRTPWFWKCIDCTHTRRWRVRRIWPSLPPTLFLPPSPSAENSINSPHKRSNSRWITQIHSIILSSERKI